jgi:hypothetical protein
MFSAVTRASGPFFMFCAPGLVFDDTEGVGSRFLVLCARTHFRRYRGLRIPFSCFALPNSFSAIPRTLGPFFMFCAPGLVFGRTEGVPFRFQVFHYRTCFRRNRGCRVPFSCLVCPDSYSLVPWASAPVFMFYAPELIFGGTEGVPSCFLVFRSRTCFWRYRGRRVPFSCFALPDTFSAIPRASGLVFMFCASGLVSTIPRASGPVFMFCAPGHIFGVTQRVGSRFPVLQSLTHFQRYRGRRVPFSCFALPDSFSAVPRASGPIFMFCAPGLIFDGTEGVRSRFLVLRAGNHFRRYRGRRFLFSCFALPDSFSAVPWTSGPVFIFCAPRLIFDRTKGVSFYFHVFRYRTCFRRY